MQVTESPLLSFWTGLDANLRGIYIIWYRDVLRFWRDRSRIVASLAQPILFLFIFGTGLSPAIGPVGGSSGNGVSYVQFMFPGIVAMAVLFTSIFSAISIVWDREFGFLKEVLVSPLSRTAVAIGKALGGSTVAIMQGVLLLVFAPFVGVILTPLLLAKLLPLMFLMAFSLTSFGILVAARMRSMEGFQMVMNFVLMPMFFLSGALFPLRGLPTWMDIPTKINPVSYGVDPIRQVMLEAGQASAVASLSIVVLGHPMGVAEEVLVLLAFGACMLAAAVVVFNSHE